MKREGIISVGNWLVDSIKFIDRYPNKGNLTTIQKIEEGLGGCAHNVLIDLAKLKSNIPLYAGGCIGNDKHGELILNTIKKYNINYDNMIVMDDVSTSYTDVMSEINGDASRTFFHYRGANGKLSVEHINKINVPAKIFHLGYLLLLDELDKDDPEYGIVAARALHIIKEKGYITSIDVVSEESDRFCHIILPCLKYVDCLIINEIEAGACCKTNLRNENGEIIMEKVKEAAASLMNDGIGKICVIHFPEGGYALTKDNKSCFVASEMVDKKDIVSTVGAGDAFCAATLFAIHQNFDLEKMLLFANTCAKFNLSNATCTGGAPSLDEIKNYLNNKNIIL